MRSRRDRLALGVSLLLMLIPLGSAQYEVHPFEDDPVGVLAAFAAESSVLRLEAGLSLLASGVPTDEMAELLEGLELDFVRFAGVLGQEDADLLERTETAFEEIEDADEEDLERALRDALEAARATRDAVSDARLADDPAFAAAVLSLLLVSEAGVAEGWEEAFEGEVAPYVFAHVGMPRVMELWERLKPLADENQTFEIEDQLAELQTLFEDPLPPSVQGLDPEAAEDPAIRIAGFLEDVTGAWLFPDRDLAGLLGDVRDVAQAACSAFEADDSRGAVSKLAWVGFAYGEYLSGTLALFSPDATAELDELLAPYLAEEEEEEAEESESAEGAGEPGADDEDAEADRTGQGDEAGEDDESADPRAFDPADCHALVETLTLAGAPFGL